MLYNNAIMYSTNKQQGVDMSKNVSLKGVGISVTENMQQEAAKRLSKLFERFPDISHTLTVKPLPGGRGVDLTFVYHAEFTQETVSASGDDFYSALTQVRERMLSKLDGIHKKQVQSGRRAKSQPVDEDLSDDEEADGFSDFEQEAQHQN